MSALEKILEPKKGNLLLKCKDGELLVHKDVLATASRKLEYYLESQAAAKLPELSVSYDTIAQWKLVLGQLYPICPRPELGLEDTIEVLGIAQKWELAMLLSDVSSSLVVKLPLSFTMDTEKPGYVLKWLVTAEEIQLEGLRDACLLFLSKRHSPSFRDQAAAGKVDQELDLLAPGTLVKVILAVTSPGAISAAAGCISDIWPYLRTCPERLWTFLGCILSSVPGYSISQKKAQRVLEFCVYFCALFIIFLSGIVHLLVPGGVSKPGCAVQAHSVAAFGAAFGASAAAAAFLADWARETQA
eukprot:gene13414-19267_t